MRSYLYTWRVFQIIPLRSESESGTTLDRINRDVGVENEILMDNTPAQTGYNKEMQRVARLARNEARTTKLHFPQKNKAESVIKIVKGKCQEKKIP